VLQDLRAGGKKLDWEEIKQQGENRATRGTTEQDKHNYYTSVPKEYQQAEGRLDRGQEVPGQKGAFRAEKGSKTAFSLKAWIRGAHPPASHRERNTQREAKRRKISGEPNGVSNRGGQGPIKKGTGL